MREGYKKTEVGVIPEDWEVKKLGECIKVKGGYAFKSKDATEYGTRWLKISNVSHDKISWENESFLPKEYLDIYEDYKIKLGDYVVALTRPITRGMLKIAQLKKNDGVALLNQRVGKLETLESNDSTDFMYYVMSNKYFINKIEEEIAGTDPPNISTSQLENIKIAKPPLKEQEKIAEIFSTVDSQIDDIEKLIEKSKELKKGLMQKLLTKGIGHSEFKKTEVGEIPVSWEVKKLGEIVDIKSGSSPSKFSLSENGRFPFFKVDDMNYGFKYLNNSKLYFNLNDVNLMKSGMVIFPKRGASIFTNKILILNQDGYFDTNLMGLSCKESINNEFLYYSLYYNELSRIADTSSIPQINNKHIEPLKIALPSLGEQDKIVQVLSLLDNEIEKYENNKQKLEELKKGLMQQLLTGKIRTV